MADTTRNLSCRVPVDVAKRIEKLAEELDLTMSKVIGISLNAGLDQVELLKSSVLIRAALKVAEHLDSSKAVRDELKMVNEVLDKGQAEKAPLFRKELGLE